MYGIVKTAFGNSSYQMNNCETPILIETGDPDYDPRNVGQTCLVINDAAESFYTYQQYMSTWRGPIAKTTQQEYRPVPVALFLQNTTVNGTWINIIDTTAVSKLNNRVINNVTLAMPHIGVYQAAHDPLSNILQPDVCL
jgi:hypothetical protein